MSQLTPLFGNPQAFEQMLRSQVSEINGSGRLLNANALKLVQSDELPILLAQGSFSYYREQIIESWGVGTATQNEAGFKQLMKVIGDISCDYC